MSEKPPTMREPQKRGVRAVIRGDVISFAIFSTVFWARGVATEGPLSFSAPPLQTNKQTRPFHHNPLRYDAAAHSLP